MNSMIKELPFEEPEIITFVYEAYPLGIMKANGVDYKEWLYSNFIQLNCHDDIIKNQEVFNAFYGEIGINSPFLSVQKNSLAFLKKMDIDYVEYFRKCIDLECYVYLKMDEYYISERHAFQKYKFIHDEMILGYDDRGFEIIGYDDTGMITRQNLDYNNFIEAIDSNETDFGRRMWADDVFVIHAIKNEYKLNVNAIRAALRDYLDSCSTSESCNSFAMPLTDTIYGLAVYDKINEYLCFLEEHENIFKGNKNIDNKVFRIIMEHKTLMLDRIDYLRRQGFALDDLFIRYVHVKEKAKIAHMLAVKYEVFPQKEYLSKLKTIISEIRQEDADILEELYLILSKKPESSKTA